MDSAFFHLTQHKSDPIRQFCVFGNPISHSLSPILHNAIFKKLCIRAFYGRFCAPLGANIAQSFKDLRLSGANITIPFKENAYKTCDELSEEAMQIGAVNTLYIGRNQQIIGHNTDAAGFFYELESLGYKSALIIGSGGSARAVGFMLAKNDFKTFIFNPSSRNFSYFTNLGFICLSNPKKLESIKVDVIINTTPSGLTNDNLPINSSLLESLFAKAKCAYDLVYRSDSTPFLKLAKTCSLVLIDGINMLINQAALSATFFDKNIEFKLARSIMREALSLDKTI